MSFQSTNNSDSQDLMMEINTTPLIDVMLVLLIMFIITIPIQLQSVNLELPVGNPAENPTKVENLEIAIDADSLIYLAGLPISAIELDQKMSAINTQVPQPALQIKADKNSKYSTFANILASTKRHGLNKVAIVAMEQAIK